MSGDDLVSDWKDPERRVTGSTRPHPAGEIDLDVAIGGNQEPTGTQQYGCGTFSVSTTSCGSTNWLLTVNLCG